jgi:hypothetical protein
MTLVLLKRYEEAREQLKRGASIHPDRREFSEAQMRLARIAPAAGPRPQP